MKKANSLERTHWSQRHNVCRACIQTHP